MKRIIPIILLLSVLLSLSACGQKAKEETRLLRIGVLEPLTGKYAKEGTRETLGIQYANITAPTVQLGGKEYRVELMIKDNASDPVQSAQAAQELVEAGCAVVLGSYGDELSLASSDTFFAAGVPAITASGSDPAVTRGNDHYFRINALPAFQGAILAGFAKRTLSVKSAYCLIQAGSDEDAALLHSFRAAAEALELKVTAVEFPANNIDFSAYLTAAKEEGAGVIFAPCAIQYAQRLIEQSELLEAPIPFLADQRWEDPAVLSALQEKDLKVYVSAYYAEGADSEFDSGFKEWLNSNSDALLSNGGNDNVRPESVLGYDAYFTALSAAKAANSADKADILAILPSVTHTGVAGSCSFSEDGDAVRSALWIKKANPKAESWSYAGSARAA